MKQNRRYNRRLNKHRQLRAYQAEKARIDRELAKAGLSPVVRNRLLRKSNKYRDLINEMMQPDFPDVYDDIDPIGPMWTAGGFEKVIVADEETGYEFKLLFLPDKNNKQLKNARKPMQFYYAVETQRFVKDEDGHYKFNMQKFSGIMDSTKNIGVDGYAEVAGGFLTFTTTLALPEGILEKAQEILQDTIEQQYGDGDLMNATVGDFTEYIEVNLAPIPMIESSTRIHRVGSGNEEGDGIAEDGHNIESWACKVQGEGQASLNPLGTNAFSVMLGQYPVQLIEAAMTKGAASNLTVENEFKFKVWLPAVEIIITGNWESIYEHISTAVSGRYFWFKGDIEVAFDDLQKQGAINVEVKFDGESVTPEQQAQYNEIKAEVIRMFTEQATNIIFEPVTKEEAAKAKESGGLFGGLAFKVKWTKDTKSVKLHYRETVDINTVRSTTVRANLDGFANEIAENPELIDRYFQTVYLEEGFKKIHVFATANANWEQVDGRPGDPINRLSVQVGYPDSKGNINWKSAARYKKEDGTLTNQPDMASWTLDNKDRIYVFDFTKHENLGEDQNKIYIRKDISFNEDPRVPVNTITEEYTVDGDETIEVRAETAGKVSVGPIDVDTPIETDQVKAIVTFKVPNLEPQVFELNTESMKKAQYFEVWYEKPEDVQAWQYKVEAIVKGKRFGQKSVRWASNWEQGAGNGPITVSIPAPTDKQNRLIEEYLTETAPAEAVA